MSAETSSLKAATTNGDHWWQDMLAGGSLGALLGLLMGLSTSPIVSIVITALVALLGALFGLTEKKLPVISGASAFRLCSFAMAAFVVTPAAVWIRTHELLSPSVEQQITVLQQMGVPDGPEQYQMLRYLRFGIRPSTAGAESKEAHPAPWTTGLYSSRQTFCDKLVTMRVIGQPPADYISLFADAGDELQKMGEKIIKLPQDRQKAVFESADFFLCVK